LGAAAAADPPAGPSRRPAPPVETAASCAASAPQVAAGEDAGACGEGGDSTITPRLQSAVARVLPAIEATVATLAAGATHPRELERAARALAALTRTLRELNGLLSQRQAAAVDAHDDMPEDIDAFRLDLARRINAFVAARTGKPDRDGGPQAP
jgi:hypothetical protein